MKKLFMKFSDERNKKHSIETIIAKDGEKRTVIKKAIYPEGKEHLKNIAGYYDLLVDAYPDCKICPVKTLPDGSLEFEYISGDTYHDCYQRAVDQQDVAMMEDILMRHKVIIESTENNRCPFEMTPAFAEVFGEEDWEGEPALRVTNFDTTAGNIKISDEKPIFIDYEWVFTFPIPLAFSVYYSIRDAYYHVDGLEEFYPLAKALEFLGIEKSPAILEQFIPKFFSYVVCEADGASYGLSKHVNLKGTRVVRQIIDSGNADELFLQPIEFAEKRWKEASEANSLLSQQVLTIRQEYEQQIAANQQQYNQTIQQLNQEIQQLNQQIDRCNQQINDCNQQIDEAGQRLEQTKDQLLRRVAEEHERGNHWENAYGELANNRVLRAMRKTKKVIGKK